jgi:hypothetical protein
MHATQFADAGKLTEYNNIIRHETLRVAVLNNVEDTNALPAALRRACLVNFVHLAELYDIECESYAMLDGTHFKVTSSTSACCILPYFHLIMRCLGAGHVQPESRYLSLP